MLTPKIPLTLTLCGIRYSNHRNLIKTGKTYTFYSAVFVLTPDGVITQVEIKKNEIQYKINPVLSTRLLSIPLDPLEHLA